jgi:hypothetical protein
VTGKPFIEVSGENRPRRLTSDATTSEALEQTHTFARRTLLFSLALTSTLARAALSTSTSAAKVSARLTATEFVASQVKSVKLVFKLPAPNQSYSYGLTLKKGATWQPVNRATKSGNSSASRKRLTVSKLFGGRSVKVGLYQLQLSCAGASKSLSFRISPLRPPDQEELHDLGGEIDQADLRLLEAEQELRPQAEHQEGLEVADDQERQDHEGLETAVLHGRQDGEPQDAFRRQEVRAWSLSPQDLVGLLDQAAHLQDRQVG